MSETRGERASARLAAIGIEKTEFADRAGIDRTTLYRALKDDPNVRESTWGSIDSALADLELELSMASDGSLVTSTVNYKGVDVIMKGTPAQVVQSIRELLGEQNPHNS